MPEKIVNMVRTEPHVAMATGTFVKYIDSFNSITGIHLDEFNAMSGGLKLIKGRLFRDPDDLVVDEVFAQQHHLKPGSTIEFGHMWRVSGIVESGKLSRTFADIGRLQELFSGNGQVSTIYVKLDNPDNTKAVIGALQNELPTYKVDSIEDFVSLFSTNSVPYIEAFTNVVIGMAVFIGFLVVCLSMYTAVLERTREIGILKALGASPAYIVGILMRETVLLALTGTVVGILMTYGTRSPDGDLRRIHAPGIVPDWYPAGHRGSPWLAPSSERCTRACVLRARTRSRPWHMTEVIAQNLTKTYRVGEIEVHALRGVNLKIDGGEFVAIVGPSGSGKSTLFNILGGLTPPTSGTVLIDGRDLIKMSEADRTRLRKTTVGFVFQKYNLLPTLTGADNIEIARDIAGKKNGNQPDPQFEEILKLLGIAEPPAPQAPRAFGRRTTAHRHRPGTGESPGPASGRRAHRKPGFGKLHRRSLDSARPE